MTNIKRETSNTTKVEGLKKGAIGGWKALIMSFGLWNPGSLVIAMVVALWFVAGNGAWLSFLIGLVIVVVIATCLRVFAMKIVGSASTYSYAEALWGDKGRVLMGSFMLGGNLCASLIYVPAMVIFGPGWMNAISPVLGSDFAQLIITFVCTFFLAMLAIRGLEESLKIIYVLVTFSVIAVFSLMILVVVKVGINWGAMLTLEGVSLGSISLGVLVALAGLVAFEMSASLAYETNNPKKIFPRILYAVPVIMALLYTLGAIMLTNALNIQADALNAGTSPSTVLGDIAGAPWLGIASAFAIWGGGLTSVLGVITFVSRNLATFATAGMLPTPLAKIDKKRQTPVTAIIVVAAFMWSVPWLVKFLGNMTIMDVYIWVSALVVNWWVGIYVMMCIGAIFFLKKTEMRISPIITLCGIIGACAMTYVFVGSFIWPDEGTGWAPYVFLIAFAIIYIVFLITKSRDPAADKGIDL